MNQTKILEWAIEESNHASRLLEKAIESRCPERIASSMDLCNRSDWKVIEAERALRQKSLPEVDENDLENVQLENKRQIYLKALKEIQNTVQLL